MSFDEIENKLKQARQIYTNHEIPKEVDIMIKKTINSKNNTKRRAVFKYVGSIAATFALIIFGIAIGVNTNEAFAKSLDDIPVLSQLAKLVTFREFTSENDIYKTEANIPAVTGMSDEGFQSRINDAINEKITTVIEEAEKGAEEYKDAFMATGGKEEDFMQAKINVDYELKFVSEDILSFIIVKTDTTASAYNYIYYYNIDLLSNEEITLQSIFGSEYIKIINESIKNQIDERETQNPEDLYFKSDMGGFESIKPDQKFYINSDKKVVIIFDKYEIAPGYMGVQEFVINYDMQIRDEF